ncbi:MAG: transpeptidase family protein [Rikenellaceae bacterium]|jgi:cell division protein FtsI (penicillin-binding protein 3)|nr:transpeptidase family protein [Rikenellaceae bacterium]
MEKHQSPIKQGITRRAWIVYGLFFLFGVVIVGRILFIQYGPESARRRAQAVDSRTFRTSVIEAVRGDILDDEGRLLATSAPYYILRMDFRAQGLTDSIFDLHIDGLSRRMAEFFKDKTAQQYKNQFLSFYKRAQQPGAQRTYGIAPRQVSYDELRQIRQFPLFSYTNVNTSGFAPEKVNRRVLPYGSVALRTIGRRVNDSLMWGIEGAFDRELKGQDGVTRMQRISGRFWSEIADENNRDPKDGYDVVTTLDIELQDVADRALRAQLQEAKAVWGTAILMEVATGEIRAMANLTRRSDDTCVEDLNHAIAQRINPGSTFKLANLMVLLEDAGVTLDEVIDINYGTKRVGPRLVTDSHRGPQTMTLREAFYQSSNVAFAQLIYDHYRDSVRGVKTNQQRYVDQLTRLGVRDSLPFQLEGLRSPRVHDTQASTWSDWSLPSMAYGYELEMTPLQTLCLYNTVANGGKMMEPMIVKALQQYGQTVKTYRPRVLRERISSPKTIALAQEALRGVATDGTGKTLLIDGLDIAVKTGTAQVPVVGRGYSRQDYLATLVGYFPADAPKYSLIVAIQTYTGAGGGSLYYGGSLAGPVFKAIAERVYGKSVEWNPPVAKQLEKSEELPLVRGGEYRLTRQVLNRLDVSYPTDSRRDDWVAPRRDSTGTLSLNSVTVDEGVVPEVSGMGLRDAVRLLESWGMRVTFSGKGGVVRQSVAAGSPITTGEHIHLTLHQ